MSISVRRTTLRAEVIKADPSWVKDRRWHIEYEFSNGRKFMANVDQRGIYPEVFVPGDFDNPHSIEGTLI